MYLIKFKHIGKWNLSAWIQSCSKCCPLVRTHLSQKYGFTRLYRDTVQVRWETCTRLCGTFIQHTVHQILSESAAVSRRYDTSILAYILRNGERASDCVRMVVRQPFSYRLWYVINVWSPMPHTDVSDKQWTKCCVVLATRRRATPFLFCHPPPAAVCGSRSRRRGKHQWTRPDPWTGRDSWQTRPLAGISDTRNGCRQNNK